MSSKVSSGASAEALATTTTWEPPATARYRENPERLAWIVILSSFVIFCVLAVAIPLTVNYTIQYATISQTARLQTTLGNLLLYRSASSPPIAITASGDTAAPGEAIIEDNRIAATSGAQGTLRLISDERTNEEEVLGSVQIFPDTDLRVLRIRRPFFRRSTEPYQVRLRVEQGQAQFFTNSGDSRPVQVQVETPHGVVNLAAGAYWIWVEPDRTEVRVRTGSALLVHPSKANQLSVTAGLLGWMTTEELAQTAVSAQQNLIQNGNFAGSALETWTATQLADYVTPGNVQFDNKDGRRVAYFSRQGEENNHNEVEIKQEINKDVLSYNELVLQLDVNVLWQSLSGAGISSSEFPVRVEINYTSIYGQNLNWGLGFYYRDPEPPNPEVVGGLKIEQAQWYHYESENLIDLLEETRPARINSIRIYASGWNYRSMVSEVYLYGQ
jgi:hypothetical protein